MEIQNNLINHIKTENKDETLYRFVDEKNNHIKRIKELEKLI